MFINSKQKKWAEAKERFNNASSEEEKLEMILDDVFYGNSISEDKKTNLFQGKIRKNIHDDRWRIEPIRPILSSSILYNPYRLSKLSVNIDIDNRYEDGEPVVFTVRAGSARNSNEILACDQIVSFSELGIDLQSGMVETLKRIVEGNFAQEYEKEINEYIASKEWPEEFEDFIAKKTNLENETEHIKENITAVQQELARLQQEKEGVESEKNNIEDEICLARVTLDELKTRIKYIKGIVPADGAAAPDRATPIDIPSDETLLQVLKSRLRYSYADDFLVSFLMALNTNQIITLFGKPGTGKTSFVVEMSKALGAKCTIISVQNNWTDSADILGYYSPIHETYESTPFVEALLAAKESWETSLLEGTPSPLHIICLDEMNLARVEYYFAEFLSKLQLAEDNRRIQFLPAHIRDEIRRVESRDGQGAADDEKEKHLLKLKKYMNFNIPPNVRFVGTINNDDTTSVLSPKVIDRSFYLEMNQSSDGSPSPGELPQPENDVFFPCSLFQEPSSHEKIDAFGKENHRFVNYARKMLPLYQKLCPEGSIEEFCDMVIVGKVLPALKTIDAYTYDESFEKAWRAFDNHKPGVGKAYNYLGGYV